MDLKTIDELKDRVTGAKDFGDVFTFFFDHLAEDKEFMEIGVETKHELLDATLRNLARMMFGPRTAVSDVLFISVPGTTFIHGPLMVAGKPGSVIYFDDIQTGILCVSPMPPAPPDAETKFSRFRLQKLPPGAVGSVN